MDKEKVKQLSRLYNSVQGRYGKKKVTLAGPDERKQRDKPDPVDNRDTPSRRRRGRNGFYNW